MKLELMIVAVLIALSSVDNATAGAVTDTDLDRVPDPFDNCTTVANGPSQLNNQIDGDLDGYGNACDGDYNNNGALDGVDFVIWIAAFNTIDVVVDLTGDGVVNGEDFGPFIGMFNTLAGPSGLACAGTIPCLP